MSNELQERQMLRSQLTDRLHGLLGLRVANPAAAVEELDAIVVDCQTAGVQDGPTKRINSRFALLSVRGGRRALARRCEGTRDARIPVTIRGFITGTWSGDDGVDQEFAVDVTGVEEGA